MAPPCSLLTPLLHPTHFRWALGILIYEMLVGVPPFTDDHDPMQIYQKVLKGTVPEPKGQRPLPPDSKKVIEKLLARDPSERLGCQKLGTEEVKRSLFFSKLNWHRLEKKLIQVGTSSAEPLRDLAAERLVPASCPSHASASPVSPFPSEDPWLL